MQRMLQLRNRHFFLLDFPLLTLAAYASYVLRLDRVALGRYWSACLWFIVLVLLVYPLVYFGTGLYARYWRFASIGDLLLLCGSVLLAWTLHTLLMLASNAVAPFTVATPRSVMAIFLLLAIMVTVAPRLLTRAALWWQEFRHHSAQRVRVLIYGAGKAGAATLHDLMQDHKSNLHVVGFVDDDPSKHHLRIHGVPVLGDRSVLTEISAPQHIEQVIIAMPTASGKEIRVIRTLCEELGVEVKLIPGIHDLLSGGAKIGQLRSVRIEDLLRRELTQIDDHAVCEMVRGKRVLVTGAGGSIGGELCRQIMRCQPASLALLGHGEDSIFKIHNQLQRLASSKVVSVIRNGGYGAGVPFAATNGEPDSPPVLQPIIADVRFPLRLKAIFASVQPQIVFHAAAHKHVPLMEMNPVEAFTTNVLGTRNLLNAAQASGVERVVMISSDKAVNPTNVMGASKRAAEMLVLRAAKTSGLPFVAVRFGNVLGSRGSVVLTFQQQIADGGPITVTHPEMTRFFMTIPEAVQLVLQAAVLGRGGEIFLLDMGEPVKIVDLAKDMVALSGMEVGRDIDIEFSGIRPGEKLYEELFVTGEQYRGTEHGHIFIAANASSLVTADLDGLLRDGESAVERDDNDAILRVMTQLVPEYRPDIGRRPG